MRKCASDLQCVEHGAGASTCDYAAAGRWLTFLGNDAGRLPSELRALRLEGANHRASISLSTGVVDQSYQLIDIDSWSPNGRHLIVSNTKDYGHLDTNRLFLVEFGDGLPTAPVLLKDIPASGSLVSGPWAPDSSAVFVKNFGPQNETYLVHLTPEGAHSELLFRESADTSELHFCGNPRWFYRTVGDDTKVVDSQHPADEKFLWHGATYASSDSHWLLSSDDATGIWQSTCEAGAKVVHLSDVPSSSGFQWSHDGRFVSVVHDDKEIEVLDSAQRFKSVFKSAAVDCRWAPASSRLIALGARDAKGEQAITEIDVSRTPVQVTELGSLPAPGSFGFMNDGTLWATREEPEGSGLWLLAKGTSTWRALATRLSDAFPTFSPDERYAIFKRQLNDGTTQLLAFSLPDPQPMAIPLLPEPASGDVRIDFYAGGVLVSRFVDIDFPFFEGQIWWIPSRASGFAQPVPLIDVMAGAFPTLQPQP
ncbi:MAG TPA: hypothetical protein VJT73_00410 [Polyangiaceae bacterium]|nr:hypothetical protein [Polyangiaceae bacterium]